MKKSFLSTALLIGLTLPLIAAPLTESTFTEIVKDVKVVASGDRSAQPAQLNNLLKAPDRVRTGPDSRAELTSADKTITRVGAKTVFAYSDSGRTVNLEQGNLLFHAPKGLGGGTIKSGGAAAAVLGTTLIVSATPAGGFKVILLEGKGKVTLPNGQSVTLTAGQEVLVLPGGTKFSSVLDINLNKLVEGSLLVNGFSHELSSLPLIAAAIQAQDSHLKSGKSVDTGLPPEFFLPPAPPGNGLTGLDPGTYQTAVHPPLSIAQFESLHGPPVGGNQNASLGGTGGRGVITFQNSK